jgi:multidrug efflux pump subunit AcrB
MTKINPESSPQLVVLIVVDVFLFLYGFAETTVEVDEQITLPIETLLWKLHGIQRIRSRTSEADVRIEVFLTNSATKSDVVRIREIVQFQSQSLNLNMSAINVSLGTPSIVGT